MPNFGRAVILFVKLNLKERYVMYHHKYAQVEAMRKEAALSVIQVS